MLYELGGGGGYMLLKENFEIIGQFNLVRVGRV